jgi:hypothetical protein
MSDRGLGKWGFAAGLLLLAGYWYSVRPAGGFQHGYYEDFGNHEMARQLMAENLRASGWPRFVSDKVMAPFGLNLVYFAAWNIERDWIGGWVYALSRDFPFTWVHFGISLLLSYLGAGYFLGRMGLGRARAWALAGLAVLVNLPRHSQLWHHSDNVMLHWYVIGAFFDAWLWQRYLRERRIDLRLEGWRAVILAATLWGPGYTWGAACMIWIYVRVAMGVCAWHWRRRGQPGPVWVVEPRRLWAPVLTGLAVAAVDAAWFVPLARVVLAEKQRLPQLFDFFSSFGQVFHPVWLEQLRVLTGAAAPFDHDWGAETYAAVGWAFWLLTIWSIVRSFRRFKGPGFRFIAPFVVLIAGWILFQTIKPDGAKLVAFGMPFMKYFRTACRMAIYMPVAMVALAALSMAGRESERPGGWRRALGWAWAALLGLEASWLVTVPVIASAALPVETEQMFEKIRALPGDTVLTMPFCVAGANGPCTTEQCPQYPATTVSHSFRVFHGKKVYGVYASRTFWSNCKTYGGKRPYEEWFEAWRDERCFSAREWEGLCRYLDGHKELSALLVLPDVWYAARDPSCQAAFRAHLGEPLGRGTYVAYREPTYRAPFMAEVWWFAPRCK